MLLSDATYEALAKEASPAQPFLSGVMTTLAAALLVCALVQALHRLWLDVAVDGALVVLCACLAWRWRPRHRAAQRLYQVLCAVHHALPHLEHGIAHYPSTEGPPPRELINAWTRLRRGLGLPRAVGDLQRALAAARARDAEEEVLDA